MQPLAIVTGTSRGIGLAVAQALLDRGWGVLGASRGPAGEELGPRYKHTRLDLSDLTAVEAWGRTEVAPQVAAAPRVALVNNAGILDPLGPADGLPLADLDTHLRVNLTTPTWLAGLVVHHTAPRTPVRIINLSSGAATKPYPGWIAYCSGKAGLQMAGEVLAIEPEAYGEERDLAVVSYAPNVVATAMQAQLRAADETVFPLRQRFVELHEEGGLVDAQGPAVEIANLCGSDGLPAHSTMRFSP